MRVSGFEPLKHCADDSKSPGFGLTSRIPSRSSLRTDEPVVCHTTFKGDAPEPRIELGEALKDPTP